MLSLKKRTDIKCSYSGTSINYNEWQRDCQNLFTITRFCYIAVLFRIFYHHWGKKYCPFGFKETKVQFLPSKINLRVGISPWVITYLARIFS